MPKILVIRLSSIGDIVLTSPVVRVLKKQILNSEIHFLTKNSFRELVEFNPYIDKCFFLEESLSTTISLLKAENYDYIIDLHHNLRSWFIKLRLGKPFFTYPKNSFKRRLWLKYRIGEEPQGHVVDWYMKAVQKLGVHNDEKGTEYFFKNPNKEILNTLPALFRQENLFVALVIGASNATKKLPFHKLVELCRYIKEPIIILGGKAEIEMAELVCNTFQDKTEKSILNVCGKYSLSDSALIIKHSKYVVGYDTGLTHIASALKKHVVSIWGSTNPTNFSPYKTSFSIQEVKNLSCHPCSTSGLKVCPKSHHKCMNDIVFDF